MARGRLELVAVLRGAGELPTTGCRGTVTSWGRITRCAGLAGWQGPRRLAGDPPATPRASFMTPDNYADGIMRTAIDLMAAMFLHSSDTSTNVVMAAV